MKKVILVIGISLAIVFLFSVNAFAASGEGTNSTDDLVAKQISNQLSVDEFAVLSDTDNYEESLKTALNGKKVTDFPVLKVYKEIYWEISHRPLSEIVFEAEKTCAKYRWRDYAVFDQKPYVIRVMWNAEGKRTIGIQDSFENRVPAYISNVLCILNGEGSGNTGIYCFDAMDSHQGAIVYLQAENGVTVKYYSKPDAAATDFSEEEFKSYARAYYEKISSYEYNYNEKGEALGGNNNDFLSFVQENSIAVQISSQLSDAELAVLSDTDNYEESLKTALNGKKVTDFPLLKVYNEIYWSASNGTLSEIVTEAEKTCLKNGWCEYVVFDKSPYKIRVMSDAKGKYRIGISDSYTERTPVYISDILSILTSSVSDGENSALKGICCFDATTSHQGAVVYLQTENGVMVKYYSKPDAVAIDYSEEEFKSYARAYYEKVSSYEYNYNEKGEALGGSNDSYLTVVQNQSNEIEPQRNEPASPTVYIVVGIVGVAVIAGIWMILRERKRSKN